MIDGNPPVETGRKTTLGRIVVTAILLLFTAMIFFTAWFIAYVVQPGPSATVGHVVVKIPPGSSVDRIGKILGSAGLIKEDYRFLLLAKMSGYAKKLQAGEFKIKTGQKPLAVLRILSRAHSIQYTVTIPEGLDYHETGKIFAKDGWCDIREFETIVFDQKFIEDLGIDDALSLEGYLYPDTYMFVKGSVGAEKIILRMVNRFFEVWRQLVADNESNINRKEVIILASIVEKEAAVAGERPIIAGVFLNRLRKKMRLQSDPTVTYGMVDFNGVITRRALRTPTPYNTYIIPGLPVGPICNPGKAAINAVLNPIKTEHLYFVAKNDGTHKFSKTLVEHNRAVRKYQRKKKRKKSK